MKMRGRDPRRLVILLGLLALVMLLAWKARRGSARQAPQAAAAAAARLLPQLLALEARERQAEETAWAPEMLAQRCGAFFDTLWDALNSASDRVQAAMELRCPRLILPVPGAPESLPHGITRWQGAETDPGLEAGLALDSEGWRHWLAQRQQEGWGVTQIEFRHTRFTVDSSRRTARSAFEFRLHAGRNEPAERAAMEGELAVDWQLPEAPDGLPVPSQIDARRLTLTTRPGLPPFRPWLTEVVQPPSRSHFIDPLILRDLDGDGRSEIILASANRVYELQAGGRFGSRALCVAPSGLLFTALVEAFDEAPGDDLLTVQFDGLFLASKDADHRFGAVARQVWKAPERIRHGQALTCGDVDGDGDLDVWLGQYKNPYDGGQMPTPYYDANDGHPSYLLLNDGQGRFTDATEASGLGARRWRRTYAASLVDLDGDGDLDLVVVSDFAGVALYANDGRGRFEDITRSQVEDALGFGMAHAVSDVDRDGRLDLFVTGMHCPTPSRTHALGLKRPERPDYQAMVPAMTGGNKLLLAQPDGRFVNAAPRLGAARTGWSWGCAAADFDNDSWPDLAIANGHETRSSVREYEPEFWLHDLYVGDSEEDPVVATYFATKIQQKRGGAGHSYGGWEQNRLLLRRGAAGFQDVAHLFGVALGNDSRNLAVEDLDGDGRLDLIVTAFEVWPERRQTVRVFRNELEPVGNWLRVQLKPSLRGRSPVGAVVRVWAEPGLPVAGALVAGDSHRAQQAPVLHFGLGEARHVHSVQVNWPGGRQTTLTGPAVNTRQELALPED